MQWSRTGTVRTKVVRASGCLPDGTVATDTVTDGTDLYKKNSNNVLGFDYWTCHVLSYSLPILHKHSHFNLLFIELAFDPLTHFPVAGNLGPQAALGATDIVCCYAMYTRR